METINIEFTAEQLDKVLQYMETVKAETVQDAIMKAISLAPVAE